MMSRARRIAIALAENIDAWLGRRLTRTLSGLTAAAATEMAYFEPSVRI
jgi:hypothetical protein